MDAILEIKRLARLQKAARRQRDTHVDNCAECQDNIRCHVDFFCDEGERLRETAMIVSNDLDKLLDSWCEE